MITRVSLDEGLQSRFEGAGAGLPPDEGLGEGTGP